MAVVGPARKLFEGEGGSKGQSDQDYSPSYHVEVDNPEDTIGTVLAASGLPTVDAVYSIGGRLVVCKRLRPTRVPGTRLLWIVQAEYQTPDNQQADGPKLTEDGALSDDPDQWMPQFEIDSVPAMIPMQRAYFLGTTPAGAEPPYTLSNTTLGGLLQANKRGPVINSAGTVFDPPLEDEEYWPVLRVTKYSATFDSENAEEYEGSINEDNFTFTRQGYSRTFDQYTAKLGPIKGRLGFHRKQDGTGLYYYTISYEIYGNPHGWISRVIDRGYERIDSRTPSTGQVKKTRIKDIDSNPVSEPALLDGSGQPLAHGSEGFILHYRNPKVKTFGSLGL